MITPSWQLQTPIDALIFDCDGTLSSIEGIDELAKKKGIGERIEALTAEAMGKTGMSQSLYQQRLDLVRPTQEEVLHLGQEYFTHRAPDIGQIISIFKRLHKAVYIISAGLYPAVALFATQLGISLENIFAVDIEFDSQGQYLDFDQSSALVTADGKRLIVSQLLPKHPQMIYIGDGLNDYATYDLVTRFIGYGGAYYRDNIAGLCQYYIAARELAPILPLSLTAEEAKSLPPEEKKLYDLGARAIHEGKVVIK